VIVLSLCDRTGHMVEPWLEAGHECWTVDTQHEPGEHREGNLVRVGADVTTWLPPLAEYRIVFAFPPCTDLAVSGARWFRQKGLTGLISALGTVEACRRICEWSRAPWMLENPVSTLSTYWRPPDFQFDPTDFAGLMEQDAYTKRTCLWTGGGFVLPRKRWAEPVQGSRMHRLGPSPERSDLRSETPRGFARAVFEAQQEVAA
jgi:hypothetical protein